jgi:uncharacterized protein YndB with AHSA1/START domain
MSDDGAVIEREIFISASPETVFDFLIDPALMAHWIGAFHKLEPHPGGIVQIEVSPGNVARGVFTEVTHGEVNSDRGPVTLSSCHHFEGGARLMLMFFSCVKESSSSKHSSRPMPDCL